MKKSRISFANESKKQSELAAERARAAEVQSQKRRRDGHDEWVTYGLHSAPWGTPKEVELYLHGAVEDALSKLDPAQPAYLVRRLVAAAAEKGLGPWRHAQSREKALQGALNRLAWAVKYTENFADLKQRALTLAAGALDSLKPGATDLEMQESARHAVQPVIQEYEHHDACQRVLSSLCIPGATFDELEDARDAVRQALGRMPIDADQRQLERARDAVLASLRSTIADREEKREQERQREMRKFGAQVKAGLYLDHIRTYLEKEFEFDGGYLEINKEAERLREPVRKRLIEELTQNPDITPDEIRERIEELVEEKFD